MRRLKVLVAVRLDVDRLLIEGFLDPEEYCLSFAATGQDALDMLRYNPGFDLVIADVSLPAPGGCDISRAIRAVNEYIPLIGMTAYPLDWLLKQNVGLGVDRWLMKPFSPAELEGVVWNALVRVA